jgi:putative endopeptidase
MYKNLLMVAIASLAMSIGLYVVHAESPPAREGGGSTSSPKFGAWGVDLSGRSLSVKPGDDFYRNANGNWDDRTEIPPDRSSYGNFAAAQVLSENRVHAILEEAAAGQSSDPDAPKIAAAYRSFIDVAKLDLLGGRPLASDLSSIRAATTRRRLAQLMGKANRGFQSSLFDLTINADRKMPDRYAVYLSTAGLGLPDRDYYLQGALAEKKAKYQTYVANLLAAGHWPNPIASAQSVVAYETRVADVSWSRAQQRDQEKTYNPMTEAKLADEAPEFPWSPFLESASLGRLDRIIVTTNTAVPKLARLFAKTPVRTLQAWAAFHAIDSAAPYLSEPFAAARFAFRGRELTGQPVQRMRWKRGVDFVNGVLGESVGRIYVARYFSPESKVQMQGLVKYTQDAFAARIQHLEWMTPETKIKALEKLSKLNVKIGYPVKWRDYGPYRVDANDLYGNVSRFATYEWEYEIARLNGPVDKQEWGMTPQTVNAYYNVSNNEIVFPAAILQPPFFDPSADPAVNFGGIGGVIGHEMTHGFDDQGRKSDGNGLQTDWWTAQDEIRFNARADRLGAQYSSYEPVRGYHIQGALTMGENIADMGGMVIALDAYHAFLSGRPAPELDGISGDQRFFLAWAQIWRQKERTDAAIQQTKSDPHSAAQFRVNGPARNDDGWYRAFNVRPGDAYYLTPDQRVHIW